MQYALGGYGRPHLVPGGYVPADPALYTYLGRLRALRDRRDYAHDVYGRFSLDYAPAVRQRAHELLSRQPHFQYEGSLQRVRYSRFLREVARSRICIDLPGNGDFCFRLIDYLAVGACIIGPRHGTALPVPLIEGEHIIYAKDDLSDLVDLCRQYLADDERREAISRNARRLFDDHLHRRSLAAYYLHTILCLAA
jgi:glycosyltransferase involved in cell wall biosynthesis